MVVAQDKISAAYFQEKGMRHELIYAYDLVHNNPDNHTFAGSIRDEICYEYDHKWPYQKRSQNYRRSLFGNRWNYVLRQLEEGYNVLLTDVDNVYVRYKNLSELELSPYDQILAYAGTVHSFPRTIFYEVGFTVCGGMSWLRSAPGPIEIARQVVTKCRCENTLYCHCGCDDQVAFNSLILKEEPYKIKWDQNISVPTTEEEMRWEEMTGTVGKTGHRVMIWDRHTAFRREIDPNVCPDIDKNWIAMPTGVERKNSWEIWDKTCPRGAHTKGNVNATEQSSSGLRSNSSSIVSK
jgi:hypothetical protein